MLYICTLCEEVLYEEYDICPQCDSGEVLHYKEYLDTNDTIWTGYNGQKIKDAKYEALYALLKPDTIARRRSYHTVRYQVGMLEYEIIYNTPLDELPLLINKEWATDAGADYYKYRCTGKEADDNAYKPHKGYYADRYFDDSDL
jgi:hypothetical protein